MTLVDAVLPVHAKDWIVVDYFAELFYRWKPV